MLIVLLAVLSVLAGCASGRPAGTLFYEVDPVPEGKGVVYITMPTDTNVLAFTELFVENELEPGSFLYKLENGRYVAYLAPVGENRFRLTDQSLPLHVESRQSYFIEFTSRVVDYLLFKKTERQVQELDPTVGFMKIRTMTTLSEQPL